MDPIRRSILLGAGATLGGAAVATPAARAASRSEVPLLSTYVAGTAYHQAGEAAATLQPGEPLALRRDHRNDYDVRAIEVRTRSDRKLGYLPRIDNHALANLMDAGFRLSARVRGVVADRRQPEIRLDVFLTA